MDCNNSRKRLLDSVSHQPKKRGRFDEDAVMDMDTEDATQTIQGNELEVENNPSVCQFIPNMSCADYLRQMHGIHFVGYNQMSSTVPQFGAGGQTWNAAQTGHQTQLPAATGSDDVQIKLVKGLRDVCQAITDCKMDKLTIQELTNFYYCIDAIHRNLEILLPQKGIAEYAIGQRWIVLAQCLNMCARFFGMFGWIDVTDKEFTIFHGANKRNLIVQIQEHLDAMCTSVNTYSKSLSKTDKDILKQGYLELFNAECTFLIT